MHLLTSVIVFTCIHLYLCQPLDDRVHVGQLERPVALIVSSQPYHYEVVAFFAFHLRKLGCITHAWLHPFAFHQYHGVAESFISPFVDSIHYLGMADIQNTTMAVPKRIDILVYVTMNSLDDMLTLCTMRLHERVYDLARRVVMVNHHATAVRTVHGVCHAPKCTIFHLGEHIHTYAQRYLMENNASDFHLVWAFAVFPPPSAATPAKVTELLQKMSNKTRLIAIQGSMEGIRRRYEDLFDCMRDIRSNGTDVQLLSIGARPPNFIIPQYIEPYVHVLSDLAYNDFYSTLTKVEFVVTFGNHRIRYDTVRSTASIPTAVMQGIPLVLPKSLLVLYPCIRAAYTHKRISNSDDCYSLEIALRLRKEQLTKVKEEAMKCRHHWLDMATGVIRGILERRPMDEGAEERVMNTTIQVHGLRGKRKTRMKKHRPCCACL